MKSDRFVKEQGIFPILAEALGRVKPAAFELGLPRDSVL